MIALPNSVEAPDTPVPIAARHLAKLITLAGGNLSIKQVLDATLDAALCTRKNPPRSIKPRRRGRGIARKALHARQGGRCAECPGELGTKGEHVLGAFWRNERGRETLLCEMCRKAKNVNPDNIDDVNAMLATEGGVH